MPKLKGSAGMVNRQAVGTHEGKLINRQSGKYGGGKNVAGQRQGAKPVKDTLQPSGNVDRIRCQGNVVQLDTLTPDPMNARLHPERNMAAIKESLNEHGQMTPLTVREQNKVIAVGNGRWQAMKELGWTRCAVSLIPMTDSEFLSYSLTDNRSAELAKWDFEVVARIDQLLTEAKCQSRPGWSSDELEVLRMAEWTPPPIREGDAFDPEHLKLEFDKEQKVIIKEAILAILGRGEEEMSWSDEQALVAICQEWLQ